MSITRGMRGGGVHSKVSIASNSVARQVALARAYSNAAACWGKNMSAEYVSSLCLQH